jgi:hypothetical protein
MSNGLKDMVNIKLLDSNASRTAPAKFTLVKEGGDTAAAWPAVTGRGFLISEMLKCEKICILESMNQCVEREKQSQKITIYRVRGSLTYLHNLG